MDGGFIQGKGNFISFMKGQAKTNPVEVAAFEVTNGNNNTSYFV